jgi:hypothetical protein
MKDAGMRIRLEPELREKFVNICREKDVPAAQVLRSFMREFVQLNSTKSSTKNSEPSAKIAVPRSITKTGY